MMDLGQLLRQTREAQELSLADVEAQTRIRQRYLAALESGEWEAMPNPVVGRGFLRTYARFLGLNPDELLAEMDGGSSRPAQSPAPAPKPGPVQPVAYSPIDLDLYNPTPQSGRGWGRVLRWALIVLVLLFAGFAAVRFGLPWLLGAEATITPSPTAVNLPPEGTVSAKPILVIGATETPTITPTPEPTRPPTATPIPPPTATPAPTATATPIQQISMRLDIIDRAWVQVIADGVEQVAEILLANDTRTFTAQNEMQFRTGNAAGVRLIINGQTLEAPGGAGEIIEASWTVVDGKLVQFGPATPTPASAATPDGATATPQP